MLSKSEYQISLRNMGLSIDPNSISYDDYLKYEMSWDDYVKRIIIPVLHTKTQERIRLIICESAPQSDNGIHPSSNYIFHNTGSVINPKKDRYLDQVYKGINCSNDKVSLPKQKVLEGLAGHKDGSVIILDILPSHGIKLTSQNRILSANNYIQTCDVKKISDFLQMVIKINPGILVSAVFAMPPSIQVMKLSHFINQQLSKHPSIPAINWNWPHMNLNVGQGSCPSWKALCKNVKNGF